MRGLRFATREQARQAIVDLDGLLQLPQIAVELGLSQSLRRRHKLQRTVAMLVVVPVREAVHPVPGLLQRVEGPLRPQRALLRRSERMP